MLNARRSIPASLLCLFFTTGVFAANNTPNQQQELNKLGQSIAKDNSAYKNFTVKDDQLKQIKPDYDKTDLTSTYNSMQAPTAQGSAKKWQCMSFSDANLQQLYKSQIPTERQLALDCDAIRAAEKTNDKMQGQYGDPLENELVRLFTERQNDHIKNSGTGNVNIECSPLAGTGGADTEQKCLVQMLPVEKTCNRELKVVCYNKETGKLLDGTETCGTDKLPPKSISSLGGWGRGVSPKNAPLWNSYEDFTASERTEPHLKNTIFANFKFSDGLRERLNGGDSNPRATFTFKIDQSIHPQPFIKFYTLSIRSDQNHVLNPKIIINGTEITSPLNRSGTYEDIGGALMLGSNLFKNGDNTVVITPHIRDSNPFKREQLSGQIAIGFKNKCTEIECTEKWEENCVRGDVMTGDDDTDIIEDD